MTSIINSSSNYNELEIAESGCGAFTKSILELYNLNPGNNSLTSSNVYPGIEVVSNNPSQENQTMLFAGDFEGYYKFDPLKTQILSSSTYGLVKAISENSLINSNLDIAKSQDLVETTLDSISKSYFEFMSALNGDHSLFINELSKSLRSALQVQFKVLLFKMQKKVKIGLQRVSLNLLHQRLAMLQLLIL